MLVKKGLMDARIRTTNVDETMSITKMLWERPRNPSYFAINNYSSDI